MSKDETSVDVVPECESLPLVGENRFCFVSIVKNESHVIKRCIDSIANIATSYLICDTGSTDGTPEIIESYMKEKGIPGKVVHKEWQNYGFNRSYAMEQFHNDEKLNSAKYVIWHDADEVFSTDRNDFLSYPTKEDADKLYEWLEQRTESTIHILTIYGNLIYPRCQIVRNNQFYVWKSPKHEYIYGTQDNSRTTYNGFVLSARQEGNASKDPDRCKKDTQLFITYIDKNGGYEKCPREVFYLAGEYQNYNRNKAIKFYEIRTKINAGFDQEKYISYLRLGRLAYLDEDKIKYWTAGMNMIPRRLECIFELMYLHVERKNYLEAFKLGIVVDEKHLIDESDLFVEHKIYTYLFDLYLSLAAHYHGFHQIASDINQRNMRKNINKPDDMKLLLSNQKVYDKYMIENGLIKLFDIEQSKQIE